MKKKFLAFAMVVTVGVSVYATDTFAAQHTVKSGETLSSISQEYSMSVKELQQLNDLDSTIIYPNQQLVVSSEKSYLIQPGDTLFKIATAYNVSVEQLMSWNGLTSDLIYVGNTLALGATQATSVKVASAAPVAVSVPQQQVVGTYTMEATAYTAYCTGCSGTTANGTNLRANPHLKVIAVDPNVIPLGTRVWVEGYGEAIAADTGSAIKGNRIDVFIPNKEGAYDWGRKQVTVKVLK